MASEAQAIPMQTDPRRETPEHGYWETPLIGRLIRKLDVEIGERGLVAGAREYLGKNVVDLYHPESPETEYALQRGPTLMVSNHPSNTDPLAITLTLPEERKSIKFVALREFMHLGKNFSRHILPVAIPDKHSGRQSLAKKISDHSRWDVNFTGEEAKEFNRTTIDLAAKELAGGSLVVLFPEGGNPQEPWRKGIGSIISRMRDHPETSIVFTYVEGTTSFIDVLRKFRRFDRWLDANVSRISVYYSHPVKVQDILNSTAVPADASEEERAQMYTERTQSLYEEWVERYVRRLQR